MMKPGQIRQGDILLVPVNVMPPAHTAPQAQVVLAVGELTGHAHRLTGTVLEWTVGLVQGGGALETQRYVRVVGDMPGLLTHEDHDPVPAPVIAPETTYRVVQQQQWDLSSQWRQVVD